MQTKINGLMTKLTESETKVGVLRQEATNATQACREKEDLIAQSQQLLEERSSDYEV